MYKQQVITNITNPISSGRFTNTAANVLNNLADKKSNELDNQLQQVKDLYTIEAQTTLVNSSKSLADTYNSDPVKLEQELNKNCDKLLSNIDNDDIKLNLYKQYLTLKQPLLTQAEQNRLIQEDNNKRNSIYNHINSKLGTLEAFYDNMFNGVNTQNDIADYYINLREISDLLQSKSSRNNSLFNNKDIDDIIKESNQIKINSAHKHFNTLFETDPDAFREDYNKWLNNPKSIQEEYGLSQEEYKKILSNAEKLEKRLNELGNTTVGDRNFILKQNIYENELAYQFDLAKQYKDNILKENIDFNGIKFLNNLNDMLESAYNDGLDNKTYNKYKNEIRGYYNNIANQILIGEAEGADSGGLFGDSNILYDVINIINDNVSGYNSIERADILGQSIALLNENGINLNAKCILQKEKAKKIMDNVIADYYQISHDSPNKFELIKQKKQEREKEESNKLLNNVTSSIMQQNIFDINF